ncbi:hypothetical protein [Pseudescherichia sp.]|uniref:hypothetical protein n=1 Tax=Pseudescherichia sp. TaxID=2055881 RepID=UPI00289FB276|nr:hypothetical protein [Pseudescherichia sp.]
MTLDDVIIARTIMILNDKYWGLLATYLIPCEGKGIKVDGKYFTYEANDEMTLKEFIVLLKQAIDDYINTGKGTIHYANYMKIVQSAEKLR